MSARSKKTFASALQGGILGAGGGATSGAAAGGPWGALAGGLAGGALGAFGGMADAEANAPYDALNLQEGQLNNQLLARKNRNEQTNENGFNIFKKYMGAAFKASSPSTFAAMLKPYPGLGNQGTP